MYIASCLISKTNESTGKCISCKQQASTICGGSCNKFVHITAQCAYRSIHSPQKAKGYSLCSLCSAREVAQERRQVCCKISVLKQCVTFHVSVLGCNKRN